MYKKYYFASLAVTLLAILIRLIFVIIDHLSFSSFLSFTGLVVLFTHLFGVSIIALTRLTRYLRSKEYMKFTYAMLWVIMILFCIGGIVMYVKYVSTSSYSLYIGILFMLSPLYLLIEYEYTKEHPEIKIPSLSEPVSKDYDDRHDPY